MLRNARERRTRGTRLLMPHTISYPIVPSRSAQSSARITCSPWRPISTTSSPTATSVVADVDHQLIHRHDAHDRAAAATDQHVAAGRSDSVPSRRGTPSA